jgi:hypothetical protein
MLTNGEAEDACPNAHLCASDRAFELSQEAQTFGNIATAALVTAGASTLGAAILWFTAPSPEAHNGGARPQPTLGLTVTVTTPSLFVHARY